MMSDANWRGLGGAAAWNSAGGGGRSRGPRGFGRRGLVAAVWLAAAAALGAVGWPAGCFGAQLSAGAGAALLRDSGLAGGVCIVVGADDAALPLEIAQDDRFVVQALFAAEDQADRVRQVMQERGVYGRVSADLFDGRRLPYVENLINLVVVNHAASRPGDGLALGEILRVLAPLGEAYLKPAADAQSSAIRQELGVLGAEGVETWNGWIRFRKPWPKEIDEWTHFLHGADGNPVADDLRVGPPERYQWLGGPPWLQSHETDTSLRCLVSARGRIYFIINEAPISLAGPESPPDKWFLEARDAFNGVTLWKRPIRQWGWRQWKPSWFTPRPGVIPLNLDKRLVAAGDKLYVTLGYRAPVSEVDGRTGEVLRTFDGTARTSEILYRDGSLILTVLQEEGAVAERIDLESGELAWRTQKAYAGTTVDYYRFWAMRGRVPPAKVDPTLDIATDGAVVSLLDGDSVVGVNFSDGRQRWRTPFPLVEADSTAGRIDADHKVWNGAMIVADGVVLHASPNQLAAFSAKTGEILWRQPKKFLQHLWYEWQDVFVIDGLVWTWSAELESGKLKGARGGRSTWPVSLNGYDLHSGELTRQVPLGRIFKTYHHHRCYRNKATVRYVIASRRGSEFVDLSEGRHSINNWVRGACHMGMVPANGLQYAPPHPCKCYIDEKLHGFNALAAGEPSADWLLSRPEESLQRGPAYGRIAAAAPRRRDPQKETSRAARGGSGSRPSTLGARPTSDWPTFRSDASRSGFVHTTLPDSLDPLWRTKAGKRLGAPISVGDAVFVPLIDEHQVIALRASDGGLLWRFTTGARIDSPPTYYRGALLFGSADGWVYCVRASDGSLVWRLRGGMTDRRIGAFGQLESASPVHGSVLVRDGVAYFAAGRSSHLDGGLRLCAVDALTGQVLRQRRLIGPRYTAADIEENYLLPMGLLSGVLYMEGDSLFMRSVKFNTALERQPGSPQLNALDGFLDGAYFKRMPWSMGKSGYARLIVYDARKAYGLRMFDSLQGLDPKVYFTPGRAGYLLFASEIKSGEHVWEHRIPIRGRAMAATENQLCVAGPPDVVDPADPLGAFEGRKGGVLRIFDKADGRTVSERRLASPPVFNGAAAANGRLFLTLEDGGVVCFGSQP